MAGWIERVRIILPRPVRRAVQRMVPLGELKRRWREQREPLSNVKSSDVDNLGCGQPLGILANRGQYHALYIRACLDLGVPFRVVDIEVEDWLGAIARSKCQRFLAWPDATESPWAQLFKDRCRLMEQELGFQVYPSVAECWVYENKVRLRDWLKAKDLPHPRTWVFVRRKHADAFAADCELPLVFKTSFGASSTGVKIIRSRRQLRSIIRRSFGRGHSPAGHDMRDREWGRVLLQEFLPDVVEWRLVRIGDSYFGHPKGRLGEFHSGSGRVDWTVPDTRHLDLLHRVTQCGGFRSMAVDVFETTDGRLLVNELQTVFGASTAVDQMRIDGKAGRMVRAEDGSWCFEEGDFARNACADARVLDLMSMGDVAPKVASNSSSYAW